ncbi:sulfotransferase [Marinimicrobium sp. ARAG 43.8]|uniref:sulfotransferase n=1 Tax=Marinimicrobium sp. ARAG 43.8 TaxID=3418719 RepID=UPI003CF76B65
MRTLVAWFVLLVHLTPAILASGGRSLLWRLPLLVLLGLVSGLLFLAHAVGFALDDVLFRRYRRIPVKAPVFIVGVPRSGTTHLQRQLAQDPAFTSLTLWECLLAPSITERYVWATLGRCLAPLTRRLTRWRWRGMDAVHHLGWREPEEDFLLLLYRGGCFLPALLRPDADRYWELAFLDDAVEPERRQVLMQFYRRCVQRHLYYHGTHRRLLSKNPSWTGWVTTLSDTFPDARFIACVRRPGEAVPSQLSALRPALHSLGRQRFEGALQERLLMVLHSYYRQVAVWRHTQQQPGSRVRVLPLPQLARLGESGWKRLYAFCEQPLPSVTNNGPRERRDAVPGHRYRLEDFNLTPAWVERFFADVWSECKAPEARFERAGSCRP